MPFKEEHISGPKEFRQTVAIIKKVLKESKSRTHLKRKRCRKQKRIPFGKESWEYKTHPAGSSGKVSYLGLSPFTNEKTPSFWIFQNKKKEGFFKCFSSGKGGDVFQFLMEYKNMYFEESVLFLLGRSKGRQKEYPGQLKFNFDP